MYTQEGISSVINFITAYEEHTCQVSRREEKPHVILTFLTGSRRER